MFSSQPSSSRRSGTVCRAVPVSLLGATAVLLRADPLKKTAIREKGFLPAFQTLFSSYKGKAPLINSLIKQHPFYVKTLPRSSINVRTSKSELQRFLSPDDHEPGGVSPISLISYLLIFLHHPYWCDPSGIYWVVKNFLELAKDFTEKRLYLPCFQTTSVHVVGLSGISLRTFWDICSQLQLYWKILGKSLTGLSNKTSEGV